MTRNAYLVHIVQRISGEVRRMAESITISSKTTNSGPRGDGLPRPPPDGRPRRSEHMLDTAATLLVRWGFRKTTIDDVAREAGVAKGTIYLHWKNKNDLFLAALLRAQQQTNAEVLQRIAA